MIMGVLHSVEYKLARKAKVLQQNLPQWQLPEQGWNPCPRSRPELWHGLMLNLSLRHWQTEKVEWLPTREELSQFLRFTSYSTDNNICLGSHLDVCISLVFLLKIWPLLWSSGQSSWLQIQVSGFHSRGYRIFWAVVGLERGPFSLVSTIEELLKRNSSGSGLENRDYGRRGIVALTTLHPSIRKSWH
jgi:hypothetical protein